MTLFHVTVHPIAATLLIGIISLCSMFGPRLGLWPLPSLQWALEALGVRMAE